MKIWQGGVVMRLINFSLLLLLFCSFAFGQGEPGATAMQRVSILKESYLQGDNLWLVKLREIKYFENLQMQIDELKSKKKPFSKDKKLQEKIYLLQEAQKLYKPEEKGIYHEISKIDIDVQQIEKSAQNLKFFDVVTNKLEEDLLLLEQRYHSLQRDYFLAKEQFEKYHKELLELIREIRGDRQAVAAIEDFVSILEDDLGLLDISYRMFERKLTDFGYTKEQIKRLIQNYKKQKLVKLFYLVVTILIFFVIHRAVVGYLVKKAKTKDDEGEQKYFVLIKMSKIVFLMLSFLVVVFSYIENIAASLAVFGVIGAGLTIVLKEWVLSLIAWFYIIGGNFIRPGDRIKIDKDSSTIIGDVADISMFRLTLYENITNDSITEHKKAGRIIFVPNYYILLYSVYNYTHITMQTIIDLIEINLTFNSNLQRAEKVSLEIVEKLTERYSNMAQAQYNKLKNRYSLRNMNMQTRIVFVPSHKGDGVTMGIWYISPYRQILRLKSEITKQLIIALDKCEDVQLMYTGTSMFIETKGLHQENREIF
jgi:small-conductance mechanosensitive channel/FtsZ-binding cell division protein ZapB